MGPHFSREFGGGGRQDRQFPSLTSEHCKQWSYLSITDTKAANEKGIGAFSAENTSVPRELHERKAATQHRGACDPDVCKGLPLCQPDARHIQGRCGVSAGAQNKQPLPRPTRQ